MKLLYNLYVAVRIGRHRYWHLRAARLDFWATSCLEIDASGFIASQIQPVAGGDISLSTPPLRRLTNKYRLHRSRGAKEPAMKRLGSETLDGLFGRMVQPSS